MNGGGEVLHSAASYFSLSVWHTWALLVEKEQQEINTEMGRTLALILPFCLQSPCQSCKFSLPSIACISSLAEFFDTVALFLFSLFLSFFLSLYIFFFLFWRRTARCAKLARAPFLCVAPLSLFTLPEMCFHGGRPATLYFFLFAFFFFFFSKLDM